MNAEYFTEVVSVFIAVAAAFAIFLNFLLLVREELKKCSIINRKKKNYAVLRPTDRGMLHNPDGVIGA